MDTLKDELSGFSVEFADADRNFMEAYFRLADMVADLIGPHCEVVIHSFESLENSVVKIVNGHHTGRVVGSPITDMGLKMLVNSRSYFTKNKKNDVLKSTTCVLAGADKKPIGLFCVNMNLSAPFPDIVRTLMPEYSGNTLMTETFSTNVNEIIEKSADSVIYNVHNDPLVTVKARNKAIIFQLFENGIFEFKEATALISCRLGITKHAIYKYLREFKAL